MNLSSEAIKFFEFLNTKKKTKLGTITISKNEKRLEDFPNYVDILYELEDEKLITHLNIGVSGVFSCRLKVNEFNKYMEEQINMINLDDMMLENFLRDLIDNEQNLNNYIQELYSNSNDMEKSELNELFGDLKKYDLISCLFADNIVVNCSLTRKGRHYFELKNPNKNLENEAKIINNYNAPVSNVTGNNAQINTATDYASISTIQNNNHAELDNIIDDIKKNISTVDDKDTQDAISDNVQDIYSELVSANPNRKLVRTLFKSLKCIVQNSKLGFLVKSIDKLEQFIES